ncbi:hypothetical protein J6590_046074 [Homalodisca vitripennis]|nr:hypothetical protein J6590_046074 [Homalodisca vitripennis]
MAWPLEYYKYMWFYFSTLAKLAPGKCLASGLLLVAMFLVLFLMMMIIRMFVLVLSVMLTVLMFAARLAMSAVRFLVAAMRVKSLILAPLGLASKTVPAGLRRGYIVVAMIPVAAGTLYVLFLNVSTAVLQAVLQLLLDLTESVAGESTEIKGGSGGWGKREKVQSLENTD